jgi:SAM-dependent methyltransferase
VNVLFNRYLQDVYTGYKVFTRAAFDGLSMTARTFTVEMELTAHFLRKGLVIYEVPISYRARTYSEGKKIHFSDGFRAVGAAVRYRFQPSRAGRAPTGPAARRAPDAPGALDGLEGDLGSIHARGLEDLAQAGAYRRYITQQVTPHLGASVLQVKAGLGDLTAHLAAGRERLIATDDDPVCLRGLGERFSGPGPVEVAPLDLGQEVKADPPVDSVLAVNVIEYAEDDVAVLRRMAAAARPGGNLVLLVAGYPSLAGAFEKAVGQRRYTPGGLREAVMAAGLSVERLGPINLLGGVAWWLAVRMAGMARPTPALVSAYDRLVVPAERLIERNTDIPFGQSLLCVARVPAG